MLFDAPTQGNPANICMNLIFSETKSLAYIFVADSSGLQKFPEYISNSLSFPDLQNSLRFPGFPDL